MPSSPASRAIPANNTIYSSTSLSGNRFNDPNIERQSETRTTEHSPHKIKEILVYDRRDMRANSFDSQASSLTTATSDSCISGTKPMHEIYGRMDTVRGVLGFEACAQTFQNVLAQAIPVGEGTFHYVVRPQLDDLQIGNSQTEKNNTPTGCSNIVISLGSDEYQIERFIDKKLPAHLLENVDKRYLAQHHRTIVSHKIEPGAVYIVDEFAGTDLFQAGLIDQTVKPQHLLQLGLALQTLHHHNLVHRDIKPENVMLNLEETDSRIKLGDFGFLTSLDTQTRTNAIKHLAHDPDFISLCQLHEVPMADALAVAAKNISTTNPCGTASYLSPRAAAGNDYRKSDDIYSFACTLLALTTQELPEVYGTQSQIPSGESTSHAQRLCEELHQSRLQQLSQRGVECRDGSLLTEPFVALLKDMIANVDRPEHERIEHIAHYLSKLAKIIDQESLIRQHKPNLFNCIPCFA